MDNNFSSTQMIAVLTDVQLMESLISTHRNFRDQDEQNILLQEILDKHEISRQKFDSNLMYLENNLDLYQLILDSVKINIKNLDVVDLPFLRETDSLQNADSRSLSPRKTLTSQLNFDGSRRIW